MGLTDEHPPEKLMGRDEQCRRICVLYSTQVKNEPVVKQTPIVDITNSKMSLHSDRASREKEICEQMELTKASHYYIPDI